MMQDAVDQPTRLGIQAIARAGRVLRALEAAPGGLGLAELAAAVSLPKSTVHRLAAALSEEELVASAPGGRIVLGGGLARLAQASLAALPTRLRPALESLARATGETVDLAVLDGDSVRFVDQLPGPQRLRAVSSVGAVFPLHCTANGKALLAALGPERARALLPAKLARLTPHTITKHRAPAAELAEVARAGVAFDREEHSEGICAAGAAVAAPGRPAAAALSVPVPTPRFLGSEQRLADAVRGAALQASALLGA
jgi:DNA-binding IclR family transcriptional regulator